MALVYNLKLKPLLSVVVPFYNSSGKVLPLFDSLIADCTREVQLIFVDDGSSDNTAEVLERASRQLVAYSRSIISIDHRGPGGARNAGLRLAEGDFVWFVDSDDEIFLETALNYLRSNADEECDFIDFGYFKNRCPASNSMQLSPGYYEIDQQSAESSGFVLGRLWTKIFSKAFLNRISFRYPEQMLYEDNALSFWLPKQVESFRVVENRAYSYLEDSLSITRPEKENERSASIFYDRFYAAHLGLKWFCAAYGRNSLNPSLLRSFDIIFMANSIGYRLTRYPSSNWLLCARIWKLREEVLEMEGLDSRRPKGFENFSLNFKTRLILIRIIKIFLGTQIPILLSHRKKLWGAAATDPYYIYGDHKQSRVAIRQD